MPRPPSRRARIGPAGLIANILNAPDTNEKALHRNVKNPDDAAVTMVKTFDGVRNMAKRWMISRAVVVRENSGHLDLEAVALP